MSKLTVYSIKGDTVGDLELSDDLLVLDKGGQAVKDAIDAISAARRAGTACTKTKGEVAGTGAKPWAQKGSGRARAGYRQSTVWRGGAATFGPRPRSYAVKMNKKVARLAFARSMSERISENAIKVVDEIKIDEPKTKLFLDVMKSLEVSAPCLFVVGKMEKSLALAARNIPGVEIIDADSANVYQVVRYPVIVADKAGMEKIKERLAR